MTSSEGDRAQGDLERMIAGRFDELADRAGAMFPSDLSPDDFEWRAVLDWLGDAKGRLILDVGCGRGRFVRALSAIGARPVGADSSPKLLRSASRAAPGFPLVLATATALPFTTGSMDAAIAVEVLEHLPDLDRALDEIARVLKPGGRAVLIDKNPLGVGYNRLYPNWLYKTIMERLGRWPYPRDFPFKERWRSAGSVARALRLRFGEVEIRYLDGRVRGLRRRLLSPVFALFPLLRPDIAWCCQRRSSPEG